MKKLIVNLQNERFETPERWGLRLHLKMEPEKYST